MSGVSRPVVFEGQQEPPPTRETELRTFSYAEYVAATETYKRATRLYESGDPVGPVELDRRRQAILPAFRHMIATRPVDATELDTAKQRAQFLRNEAAMAHVHNVVNRGSY